MNYRSDIDGVRALAVLMVIVFHSHLALPGGYVGVDVFFVLSGYLITTLILKDLEKGKFSLIEFWERRARRLMPALIVMVLVTLAAAWFILLPKDYLALAKAAIAQSVFAANIFFWRNSGYFDGASDEKALLHTWSLAVEEQFYMVVPVALLLVYRYTSGSRTALLRRLVLLAGGASLALSIFSVSKYPAAAFFLLPSRAWELLLGSAIAVFPTAALIQKRSMREILGAAGLLLIALPCFLYTPGTPFPGYAALPPCLGTALLLIANARVKDDENYTTAAGTLLSSKPLVFVGQISYSLYLWHWPVFVFATYWKLGTLSVVDRLGLIALSVILGILSWKYIETPFRTRKIAGSRKQILTFAAVGMAASLVMALGLFYKKGVPSRYPDEVMEVYYKAYERFSVDNNQPADIAADRIRKIGDPTPGKPVSLVIWGDSHARSSLPAFDDFCRKRGLAGRSITYSATAPLVNYWTREPNGLNERTVEWAAAVLDYVRAHQVQNVVLACKWERDTLASPRAVLRKALVDTINALHAEGAAVWVLMQVPSHKMDVPKLVVRHMLSGADTAPYQQTMEAYKAANELFYELKSSPDGRNAVFLDPSPYFQNPAAGNYEISRQGIPLYIDEHHLTIEAAHELLGALLEKEWHSASVARKDPPP
ncbi:MAG: acyltransferase family protein [Verrucomicrobiota bacterium]